MLVALLMTAALSPLVLAGDVCVPVPGTTWRWQFTDVVDESLEVAMYGIDLFDAARAGIEIGDGTGVLTEAGINAGFIERLHSRGIVVICYIDTGTCENDRADAALFRPAAPGKPTGWKGECWLDIREGSWTYWTGLMWARFELAVGIDCDGVAPDQNNPLGNDPGFPITAADQKNRYLEIASQTHARGLSAGQKNGIETTGAETIAAFDWNLNDECFPFQECAVYNAVIAAGKAVFQTQYRRHPKRFCPQANARRFSTLRKKPKLGSWQRPCWLDGHPKRP